MVGESSLVVDMGKAMGFPDMPDWQIHINEREEAQKMPHRKIYLELLALNLQTGSLREQVQDIIDEHYRNLPPTYSQTDEDLTWKLAPGGRAVAPFAHRQ